MGGAPSSEAAPQPPASSQKHALKTGHGSPNRAGAGNLRRLQQKSAGSETAPAARGEEAAHPGKNNPVTIVVGSGEGSRSTAVKTRDQKTIRKVPRDHEDDTEWLTLDDLKRSLGDEVQLSSKAFQALFNEVDTDGDGKVSKEQFIAALRSRPSVQGLQATMSLLQNAGVVEVLAKHYNSLLQRRLGLAAESEIDLPTLLEHAQPDDMHKALVDAQEDLVLRAEQQLEMLKEHRESATHAKEFSNKFAFEDGTFEGTYKGMSTFLDGVEGALGLPGYDIYAGMAMEYCNSEDSKDEFTTSNYGGTKTTPEKEYNFVVNPSPVQDDNGSKRAPVPLQLFLLASSAQKANSEERFDTPLEKLDLETRNGVKSVLLRRVLEAGLWKAVLEAAAKEDATLRRLAGLPKDQLRKLRNTLGEAIRAAKRRKTTGQPPYGKVVAALEESGQAQRAEVEALVAHMHRTLASAGLTEEEVIALRLYTGPSFMKLNGTLRERDVGHKGNNYVCTIFAVVSGMVKLAAVSPIPSSRVVYRGQSGMRLPEQFWMGNAQGVKGGVEMAFLSTTTDLQVAVDYASAGGRGVLPTVFAIRVGAVDKGAALGFLSQYPDEEEILMPPRSFLEVIDEPSLMPTPHGPVLSIPVALNCNLLSPTLEKIRDGRKSMLVATLEHTRKEIVRDLGSMLQSAELAERAKLDIFWGEVDERGTPYKDKFVQSMKHESAAALAAFKARPAAWFRSDGNFKWAMQEALDLKRVSLGKAQLWMAARNLYIPYLSKISALDCDRKAVGRLVRLFEQARRRAQGLAESGRRSEEAEAAAQGLALELCRHQELVREDVEERLGAAAETVLMHEAAAGNAPSVALMLAAGADPNATRADGRTALMLAAQCGRTETCKVLGGVGGAEANARDAEGRSCVFYAAGNGHTATARALVACGADPESRSHSQWTAVIAAAYDGYADTVRYFVEEARVDVNEVDRIGWSALFYAAQNGHSRLVRWLISEGGANVEARDSRERTALMIAAQNGHCDVLEVLRAVGNADVNAVADKGWTAVRAARKAGQRQVVKWLLKEAGARDDASEEGSNDDDMMAAKVA